MMERNGRARFPAFLLLNGGAPLRRGRVKQLYSRGFPGFPVDVGSCRCGFRRGMSTDLGCGFER